MTTSTVAEERFVPKQRGDWTTHLVGRLLFSAFGNGPPVGWFQLALRSAWLPVFLFFCLFVAVVLFFCILGRQQPGVVLKRGRVCCAIWITVAMAIIWRVWKICCYRPFKIVIHCVTQEIQWRFSSFPQLGDVTIKSSSMIVIWKSFQLRYTHQLLLQSSPIIRTQAKIGHRLCYTNHVPSETLFE